MYALLNGAVANHVECGWRSPFYP